MSAGRDLDVDELADRLVDSYQRDGRDLHLSGAELPSPTEIARAVEQSALHEQGPEAGARQGERAEEARAAGAHDDGASRPASHPTPCC